MYPNRKYWSLETHCADSQDRNTEHQKKAPSYVCLVQISTMKQNLDVDLVSVLRDILRHYFSIIMNLVL